MARTKRTTNKNNIIILCEGTETEVKYFEDIRDFVNTNAPSRFSDIRIVPIVEDVISVKNSKRKPRTLRPSLECRYYEKAEQSADIYNKYKAQPIRYVREVQLFMEEDGYMEGWAVFDKDTFSHHKEAFSLAESVEGLNIAFSSYSFEEWFLAHFERNSHPFDASVCKDSNDKDKGCGTGVFDDCNGAICLAGRLRECKYIPDYAKSQESIFENYTLSHLEQCYVNAAWMRSLSIGPIYQRNPYTDVDLLVKNLLDDVRVHHWHDLNETFEYCRCMISVNYTNGNLTINNSSSTPVVVRTSVCGLDYQERRNISLGYVEGKNCIQLEIPLSEDESFLRLTDANHIHYIHIKRG